jgi:hypothetical protein
MTGVFMLVGAMNLTVRWPPVDANPLSLCHGVSLQAIVRAGDEPEGTKNVLNDCLLNAPFAQLPDFKVRAYPFLCKIPFSLFGSVEDIPDDTTEGRGGRGGSHWRMAVKRRGGEWEKKRR